MKYNLQFFADEEISTGVEVSDTADQMETVNEDVTSEETEGSTTPEVADASPEVNQTVDMNAIYANARRRAEAEFKKQREAEDAEFARRFSNYTNPETGRPILSRADYFEALDAQERMKAKAELESKGIDYGIIENAIKNSPQIRQAEQVLQRMHQQEVNQQITNDIAELNKMDPSITSLETIPADVLELATKSNVSLVNAYKIANFGRMSTQQASAIQQRTINQIAGKSHLAPVNGVTQNDGLASIPADELGFWRDAYPGLSETELRKKYTRVQKNSQ